MTPEEALNSAIRIVGGKTALAAAITALDPEKPCTPQAITQWTRCPRNRVAPVAEAVRQAKARKYPTEHDLCPEAFPRKTKGE